MKYSPRQFTQAYYRLWQQNLVLPVPLNASVYTVKFRKNHHDEYSRVTLKAQSITDALERACYAITYSSPWRPEDIDLHAVYDEEENLLWVDEPFYEIIQKKNEFRGIARRDFLLKFSATSAAILFGLRPEKSNAQMIPFGFMKKPLVSPTGEQLYTTPGSFSWLAPAGVTAASILCVGAGGRGGSGDPISGGGGGALAYVNSAAISPGSNYSVTVGDVATYGSSTPSGGSSLSTLCVANGGANGNATGAGGTVGTGTGGAGGAAGLSASGADGAGGGGAGGYSGTGGFGSISTNSPSPGSGGGGGGGMGGIDGGGGGRGGGGVGLYGVGSNGAAGTVGSYATRCGKGGSGGTGADSVNGNGGNYGGGAGAGTSGTGAGGGAVRIIWGTGRSFPSAAT